jgi:hypothetical protein
MYQKCDLFSSSRIFPKKAGTSCTNAHNKVVTTPVVDLAYRNYMDRMEELGLVKSTGSGRWKKYAV